MRVSWKDRLILILTLCLLALASYRAFSSWSFLLHLNDFRLSMVKEGMPGSLRIEVVVTSDGLVEKYETKKGTLTLVASSTLSSGEVESLRRAMKQLRTVRGPYYRSLWDEARSRPNYLDIQVVLEGRLERNISLHNVAHPRVTAFLDHYNGIVDEPFKVLYRRD